MTIHQKSTLQPISWMPVVNRHIESKSIPLSILLSLPGTGIARPKSINEYLEIF